MAMEINSGYGSYTSGFFGTAGRKKGGEKAEEEIPDDGSRELFDRVDRFNENTRRLIKRERKQLDENREAQRRAAMKRLKKRLATHRYYMQAREDEQIKHKIELSQQEKSLISISNAKRKLLEMMSAGNARTAPSASSSGGVSVSVSDGGIAADCGIAADGGIAVQSDGGDTGGAVQSGV